MTKIKKYVEQIDEELEGAKDYSEKYVEYKIIKPDWSRKYKEMAEDELKHANYIHGMAVIEIQDIQKIAQPTAEMERKWEHEHKIFVEKTAEVKRMLEM